MRWGLFAFWIAMLTLGLSAASAQVPQGYYLGAAVPLPDTVLDEQAAPGFTLRIARAAANARERELIELAERLFPHRDSIVAAARDERRPVVLARLRGVAERPGERWWWDDYGDVLTPYAATGAAVAYYSARLRAIGAGPNPYAEYEAGARHVGSFEYTASVAQPAADAPAGASHVVMLSLSWYYGCGMLCALGFEHSRVVYFDDNGRVLIVRGDGIPAIWQS